MTCNRAVPLGRPPTSAAKQALALAEKNEQNRLNNFYLNKRTNKKQTVPKVSRKCNKNVTVEDVSAKKIKLDECEEWRKITIELLAGVRNGLISPDTIIKMDLDANQKPIP